MSVGRVARRRPGPCAGRRQGGRPGRGSVAIDVQAKACQRGATDWAPPLPTTHMYASQAKGRAGQRRGHADGPADNHPPRHAGRNLPSRRRRRGRVFRGAGRPVMSVAQSQLAARAYLVGMLAPTRRGHGSWRPGTVSPPTTTTTTCGRPCRTAPIAASFLPLTQQEVVMMISSCQGRARQARSTEDQHTRERGGEEATDSANRVPRRFARYLS